MAWHPKSSLLLDLSSCFIIVILASSISLTRALSVPTMNIASNDAADAASMGGKAKIGHVVVVGSANQDLTSYTPILPILGETVIGSSFETSCGGKGSNQAVAAASLALSPVSIICRLGRDAFGFNLLSNFARVGVAVDDATAFLDKSINTSTGTATIVVETKSGDNMIIVTPGANHELKPQDVRASLESLAGRPTMDDLEAQIAVVLVQLEIPPESALEALKVGKELGAITILNPAPAPESFDLNEFYPYIDILIPNESELRKICGNKNNQIAKGSSDEEEEMAKILLAKGIGKSVIVTLGARGALVVEKDSSTDGTKTSLVCQPEDLPCRNDPVVDTIGAGDAFCGSLATYLSAGLSIVEAGERACGFASMSVRRRGASYPTADEIPEMLKLHDFGRTVHDQLPTLTFVTGNRKKLEEVEKILSNADSRLPFRLTNRNLDLPELQGDPIEIAKEKCRIATQQIQGACLTEDTSLCFNAMNGMPGPYIKWFLEKCGHDGLNAILAGFDDKSAYAQTVFAFAEGPESDVQVFDGRTDGHIVPPRGRLDFGWDPIFEPKEGLGKTYAEMSKDEKNAISHRGRSLAKLQAFLLTKKKN